MLKCEGPVRPTEGLHLIKDDGNVKLPNSIQQIDEKATIPDVITTFSLINSIQIAPYSPGWRFKHFSSDCNASWQLESGFPESKNGR